MVEKRDVRRGYDELAEEYAARRSTGERELTILEEFLDPLSGADRLLDAGCGPGTAVLQRLSDEAVGTGLDFSREQLLIAADSVPAAALVQGDMTTLPFRDGTFDAITAYDSIIHVPRREHQTVLEEFARVVRPGGRVLVSEAPEAFERVNPNWLASDLAMSWSMVGAQTTREQLRAAGFRITKEWDAPETTDSEPPKPPFFAAVLDT